MKLRNHCLHLQGDDASKKRPPNLFHSLSLALGKACYLEHSNMLLNPVLCDFLTNYTGPDPKT